MQHASFLREEGAHDGMDSRLELRQSVLEANLIQDQAVVVHRVGALCWQACAQEMLNLFAELRASLLRQEWE
jgi:hypothetical protein